MMDRTMALGVKWLAVVALGGAVSMGCDLFDGGAGGSAGAGGEGGGGGAGGDGGTGGMAAAPVFAEVHELLQTAGCTNGYCHGGGSTGNLTLTADAAANYAALVNQPAAGLLCEPTGLMRVAPFDSDNSILWQKIAPGVAACGEKMPSMAMPLGDAQVELVRAWIAGGAKQ
jgi:predicted CxxxxCH...CXXCH cytochrome family protein